MLKVGPAPALTNPNGKSASLPWPRAILVLLTVLMLILPTNRAKAHANLVRSDPPRGAALASSPSIILLEFSEDLDPGFSNVQLLNGNAEVVVKGPGEIDPARPKVMRLPVGNLPNGIYSAIWKARSLIDGHITSGTVGFSIGVASPHASLLPPPGSPDPATTLPEPLDSLTRWIGYAALSIVLGSLLFAVLVWRPIYTQFDQQQDETDRYVTSLFTRVIQLGIVAMLIGTVGIALVQLSQVSGGSFFEWFGAPLSGFLATRTALLLGIRLALLAALSLIVLRLRSIGSGSSMPWWLAAALALGVLMTFSLQSHAAASGQAVALLLDSVHLLAMSAWLGGLLPLFLLLRGGYQPGSQRSMPPLARLIPRFSFVALISVNVLALSGIYSAITEVQSLDALGATSYGHTILIKVALVAILVGLGAINLLILTPRLARMHSDPANGFRRTTGIELAVGALVLFAAGVLTGLAPAGAALEAQRQLGFTASANADSVNLVLRIAPAAIGQDEFGVDVTDTRAGAPLATSQIFLRVSLLNNNLGTTEIEATPSPGGRFTAQGTYFVIGGQWQVDVVFRRQGFDDVIHRFYVPISGATLASATQEDNTPNPVQPDSASVKACEALYQNICVSCHGVIGRGDGPVGLTLNPRPADLTIHTVPGVHTDGQLFQWISNGYPDSAMPGFADYLSETDRWNLVNYIRTLARRQPPQP